MKGDFSRDSFTPRKHYSEVRMQQGRVQVDADWNEAQRIQTHRAETTTLDVVGRAGAPEDEAGFELTVKGSAPEDLVIGAGRYYVDGILVENEAAVPYVQQPDLPHPGDWRQAVMQTGLALAYLEVSKRHLTALEDPAIKETALGGPDTCTRVQTVWQVRLLPLDTEPFRLKEKEQEAVRAGFTGLETKYRQAREKGDAKQAGEIAAEIKRQARTLAGLIKGQECTDPYPEWQALVERTPGRLAARLDPAPPPATPCELLPGTAYRGLENQLYRVEIHKSGALGTASFKWSRDNAWVAARILAASGDEIGLDGLGPDEILGFNEQDWVELLDDEAELKGKAGLFFRVVKVDRARNVLKLEGFDGSVVNLADFRTPKVRRWHQGAAPAATSADWLDLENGVQVRFEDGLYRSGDYWLIPARATGSAAGSIEWPDGQALAPHDFPERHYARLALLAYDARNRTLYRLEDCRRLFPPLTDLDCCGRAALHVTATNWANDDLFAMARISEEGLRITLDTPPDPDSLSDEVVIVTLEVPQGLFAQSVIVQGQVGVDPEDPRVIVWQPGGWQLFPQHDTVNIAKRHASTSPSPPGRRWPEGPDEGEGDSQGNGPRSPSWAESIALSVSRAAAFGDAQTEPSAAQPAPLLTNLEKLRVEKAAATRYVVGKQALVYPRVRVRIMGQCIWSGSGKKTRWLDGQSCGIRGERADGSPRTDLALPSGNGARASDFESWFYIDPTPESFRITEVTFLDPNMQTLAQASLPVEGPVTLSGPGLAAIRLRCNRAVSAESLGNAAQPAVWVELDGKRLPAQVQVDAADATLVLWSPRDILSEFPTCRLNARGTSPTTAVLPVLKAQDGSALDGDYDGQAGGDFGMEFMMG